MCLTDAVVMGFEVEILTTEAQNRQLDTSAGQEDKRRKKGGGLGSESDTDRETSPRSADWLRCC